MDFFALQREAGFCAFEYATDKRDDAFKHTNCIRNAQPHCVCLIFCAPDTSSRHIKFREVKA